MKKLFLLVCILFLSSCSGLKNKKEEDTRYLIDLVESTHIIRTLIKTNKLGELLEAHNEEQLSLLLDNYSPAQLAFESEVNRSTIPLAIVYFFKDNPQEQLFIGQLEALAQKYDECVKFVIVDEDKLFVLAHDLQIETFPTALLIYNSEIHFNMTGTITTDVLEDAIRNGLTDLFNLQ